MLKRAIHGRSSTNCIAAVRSKSVHRGMATAKPSTAPASAVQRAVAGSRSLPMTSTAMPKAIGTQMARERSGSPWSIVVVVGVALLELPQEDPEEAQEGEYAEDHREGVVVDVAGLQAPRDAGEPDHQARRAVHHDAVDEGAVAPGPEPGADLACAAGEEPVVEVVEAVLALEDGGEHARLSLDDAGQVGPEDVEEPRGRGSRDGEPERHRAERVHDHRPPAVELLR